jgi:NADPH:quinone reductase-like Zn-dependent oxidoreductase
MKAIVCTKYGPPEVLQLKDVGKPVPKDDEVCIKIRTTTITVSDLIIRSGKVNISLWLPMRFVIGFTKPRKSILGMVFAGEVEAVGTNVKSFEIGDEVFGFDRFGFGTYAEYKCFSEEGVLVKKPTNMSYEEAVAIPYGGLLAMHYLRKGNIQR